MMTIRKCFALGAASAFAAFAWTVGAQDDLDDLLKDLEGSEKKASAAPAAVQEPQAEKAEEAEAAEESVAEAPAKAEEAEVKEEAPAKVEESEAKEEAPIASNAKVDEVVSLLKDLAAEDNKASAQPAAGGEVAATVASSDPDAELIANIVAGEKLRRVSLDVEARREIAAARECMRQAEYSDAVHHYGLALKYLNDKQSSKKLQRECSQGIAEGLYRFALQEDDIGRRERALTLMEKALDMRHPRARRVLEKWSARDVGEEVSADMAEYKHRINDEDFKASREQVRRHLRRSRQFLSVRDMKHALEECEMVLKADPYNQDAIRLRRAIERKRQTILEQERVQAREGMIADVDEAWRPVYAVNAAQLNATSAETVKTQTGEDPERTMEQDIERRMKEMRLPTISFKPPATIIDAVDFFRGASRDYDRPDIPIEKRGFNFVLKTPQGAIKQAAPAEEESDEFSSDEGQEKSGTGGLDPIPTITASDITFYEALKLVCDSVDYKFIVRGPVVMVMQKDMSTAELLSRKYDVLDAFLERMTAASSDVKEMKSQGFGGNSGRAGANEEEENQERDWKAFFEQMGVKWPEGSSIMYIKTLGKLYVRNTRENLAEFEKVLQEMGSQPKLIEIEARFVEVEQADLNSLGFEWILNSDYSLTDVAGIGKALGLNGGTWGTETGSKTITREDKATINSVMGGNNRVQESSTMIVGQTGSRTETLNGNGGRWIKNGGDGTIGVNAFGGTSAQQNGNRYLSTVGNHVSGQSQSANDQFMRVNAFLGEADLSMILHMLSQRSDTDLLSAPKVVTKSGENAVIKVVTEYIYPQDYDVQLQSSGGSSGGGSSSSGGSSAILAVVEPQNFQMREVGVILDVTPTYSEANGGTIDLELKPSVVDEPTWHNYGMKIPFSGNSSLQSFDGLAEIPLRAVEAIKSLGGTISDQTIASYSDAIMSSSMSAMSSSSGSGNMTWYDAPMEQPFFHVRSIDSKVSITPGATVVMGGLITEARKAMDDKIPFLGDLPYIGRLFRSHAEQTIKRNLLIFVTGRLITPAGRELSLGEESLEEAEVKAAPKE